MDRPRVERLVADLLRELGEDPLRQGLAGTPGRVTDVLSSFQRRKGAPPPGRAEELEAGGPMILVRDLGFLSLCEHHLLPFFGRCQIGYVPKGRAYDASACADVVTFYARRLQLQERLTEQIADALFNALEPEGIGVVLEGRHMCMMMRGVEKQNSDIETSSLRGSFLDPATRQSFVALLLHGVGA